MVLTAVGLAFAVVNGSNDGAALVAANLKAAAVPPAAAVAGFAVALGAVPALLGLRVASTLAEGLVPAGPDQRRAVMVVAIVAALAVVAVLNASGLPTSLTLAVVGGLVGAGVGLGLPVTWGLVALTAVLGVAAPIAGGLLGAVLRRIPLAVQRRRDRGDRPDGLRAGVLVLQAMAYGANDGQKIYAVLVVGAVSSAAADVPGWQYVAVPVLFSVGTIIGLRRAARALGGSGVLRARPDEETVAALSSAVAVLATAAVGIPVSMTQSVAGALIGSGMTQGTRRVRWRAAARLALAWVLTLPSAGLLALALGALAGASS